MIRRSSSVIEIIIYVGLLVIVMGVLLSFTINILGRASKVGSMVEVNQNIRFALDKISTTIRNSKDAEEPLDGGGTGSSLTLIMPDEDLSPTIFEVTNGVLTMKQGDNPAVALTSAGVEVTGLSFQNLVDPVAHARTSNTWTPCDKSIWFGVICYRGVEYCWDVFKSLWYILFRGAKAGSCVVATAAKSVVRFQMTVSSPPGTAGINNEYNSSVTFYGTATVPRQN